MPGTNLGIPWHDRPCRQWFLQFCQDWRGESLAEPSRQLRKSMSDWDPQTYSQLQQRRPLAWRSPVLRYYALFSSSLAYRRYSAFLSCQALAKKAAHTWASWSWWVRSPRTSCSGQSAYPRATCASRVNVDCVGSGSLPRVSSHKREIATPITLAAVTEESRWACSSRLRVRISQIGHSLWVVL